MNANERKSVAEDHMIFSVHGWRRLSQQSWMIRRCLGSRIWP